MTQVSPPLSEGVLQRAALSVVIPSPRPAPTISTAPPAELVPGLPVVPRTSTRRSGRRLTPVMSAALDMTLAVVMAAAAVDLLGVARSVAAAAALSWPLLLLSAGHYRLHPVGESPAVRSRRVLRTGVRAGVLLLATVPWFVEGGDPLALALLVATFSVASGVPALLGVSRRACPRVVLAGNEHDVRDAMTELATAGTHEIVAVCVTDDSSATFDALPSYSGLPEAAEAAQYHAADAVVVLPGAHARPTEIRRLHWAVARSGAQLYLGTGLLDVDLTRMSVVNGEGLGLVHVRHAVLGGPRRMLKDVCERLLATVGILLLLPFLVAVAVLIRLDSPGSPIFRQMRVGRDGRQFTMYKFRTMTCSAEQDRDQLVVDNEYDAVLFKIRSDPRVSRVGRLLRKYSVDELPQLWNVVIGDMSLVGPRPALPAEVAQYDHDSKRRLAVRPGLTGLWQVSGRSDLTWCETVRLDLRYVDNWSVALDLAILRRTVRAVLGHRGAY